MKASKWQKRPAEPKTPAFARVIRNLDATLAEPVEMTFRDLDTGALLQVHLSVEEASRLSADLADAADEEAATASRKHRA